MSEETLVKMIHRNNILLLHFDDNRVLKFATNLKANCSCDMFEMEPTPYDLYNLGVISRERRENLEAEERRRRQESEKARALLDAWRSFYQYGPEEGFAQPTKYPPGTQP